ncbi:TYROSYL-TRNA SYNTHETASE [Salix purpurea]|uniref:Tyrosine--tRNA ligase n=1 Tax=Salix purpurea TaxID=77065 RepID=A0A9Q0SKG4_SALPP|nr:TYROSYL-TRNA SYNTHETASE [Salix purpurea]
MAAAAAAASRTLLYSSHSKIFFFPFTNCSRKLHRPIINKNPIFVPLRCLQSAQQNASTTHDPMRSRSSVVDILEERGLLESITSDNLRSVSTTSTLKAYCGFDPTAESLHLGNLLGIIVLSWFQRCGHKAVALIGGATARIGDPSGKSLERPELDADTLEKNTQGITKVITRILHMNSISNVNGDDNHLNSSSFFVVMNNYDWWKEVRLLDFLKQVGRFARVGTMMGKESVKKRLESEQGMSYTEFTYQLLQGYDFLHLYQNEGINVQIGGSDQWGNITAGTELIRKILQPDGDVAFGLTFPLLLKSDGTKFGKSEDGSLKILTFLDMEEIDELEKEMNRPGYTPNTAQRRLAEQVTLFVHGEDGLNEALKATEALRPGAETKLDWKTFEGIAEDVPSCSLASDQVLNVSLIDLSVSSGLLDSKSGARRLLKQGGLYLNNSRVDSETKRIEPQDIVDGKVLLLSAGKKNKVIVRIT